MVSCKCIEEVVDVETFWNINWEIINRKTENVNFFIQSISNRWPMKIKCLEHSKRFSNLKTSSIHNRLIIIIIHRFVTTHEYKPIYSQSECTVKTELNWPWQFSLIQFVEQKRTSNIIISGYIQINHMKYEVWTNFQAICVFWVCPPKSIPCEEFFPTQSSPVGGNQCSCS